jgi:hypothetical protein
MFWHQQYNVLKFTKHYTLAGFEPGIGLLYTVVTQILGNFFHDKKLWMIFLLNLATFLAILF